LTHAGDVGTEIAPEVADDPELAARLDDLLHRTCSLARALTGAEQAALKVDLDGDGHAARKFFSLSERYARWHDYRVDPRGLGLHGIRLEPGEVVRLTQDEVEAHPHWTGFGDQAAVHPASRVAGHLPYAARVGAITGFSSSPTRAAEPTSPPRTKTASASWLHSQAPPWTPCAPPHADRVGRAMIVGMTGFR
jgi:hypothetical protein